MTVADNVRDVAGRISRAAVRAGRRVEDIKLVAITKTVDIDMIREAAAAGVRVFGENYLQEARGKIQAIGHGVEWHMTGRLQRNKARDAVNLFDMVQTVDSLALAQELDKRAGSAGKVISGLIEVNIGEEDSKSGIKSGELLPFLNSIKDLNNLSIRGLMTLPPYSVNPEEVRPYFKALRGMRDTANSNGFSLSELSMGMSHDFEVAVEEGATMVRIGTAIFGERR
ncbi:MAG: YggS family pyridoxal phosphate-dependent enzyme [Deltaproteobacteria bacterium]|nr:YggS family pyridoxal phosphate-dependent enzyme [Deltaproteobacteria bacterium]